MVRKYYLEGQVIENFTVLNLEDKRYNCRCKCGNIRRITGMDLVRKRYKSCGCLRDFNHNAYETNFRKKFWNQTKKNKNGCVEWTGMHREGYGRINYKRKTYGCTRLVWEWEKGKIPENKIICHSCDNPACVNINHLFLGTKADNMMDCVKKGRKLGLLGEKSPRARLKDEQVIKIKKLIKSGIALKEIARDFKVSKTTIHYIKSGRCWKHV
jgi:hypothetical protein